jgi:NTP pyrophosphatase (non-canonical NTP hydrolase)
MKQYQGRCGGDSLNGLYNKMEQQRHEDKVLKLWKRPSTSALNMTNQQYDLIHLAIAITSEAGEFADAVKRHVIYEKPLDIDNLKEELGDLEFYLQAAYQTTGLSRDEVLRANELKLEERYPEGTYTDRDAQERKDKNTDHD